MLAVRPQLIHHQSSTCTQRTAWRWGNRITWCQASCIKYKIWPWYNQPLIPLKHNQVSKVAFSSCYVPSYVPEDSNFWQQVSPKNLFWLTIFNNMSSSKWSFGWLVDLLNRKCRCSRKTPWIWRIFCDWGEEREPRSLAVAWWQCLQWRHQHGSQKEQVGFHFENSWMIHDFEVSQNVWRYNEAREESHYVADGPVAEGRK